MVIRYFYLQDSPPEEGGGVNGSPPPSGLGGKVVSRAGQERMKINAAGEYFRKMREEFIRQQVGWAHRTHFNLLLFSHYLKTVSFIKLQFQRLRIQFKKSFLTSPEKYFWHICTIKRRRCTYRFYVSYLT